MFSIYGRKHRTRGKTMKKFLKSLLNVFSIEAEHNNQINAEERYYSTAGSITELEWMMRRVQRGEVKFIRQY